MARALSYRETLTLRDYNEDMAQLALQRQSYLVAAAIGDALATILPESWVLDPRKD